MKTQEELNAIKEEVETLSKKLTDLTDEEIAQVSGGFKKIETPSDISIKKYTDDIIDIYSRSKKE